MEKSELGEMLPENLCVNGIHPYLLIAKGSRGDNNWVIGYSDYQKEHTEILVDQSECNVRAAMFCYLIENKLINPNSGGSR